MNAFHTRRVELANQMAATGAELLKHTNTAAALAAIPNTAPQQYVVAGTLAMIAKVLPADAAPLASQSQAAQPSGDLVEKVRAAMIRAYNLGQTYWQQADSDYVSHHKKADVTAGRFIELNDDLCAAIAARLAGQSQATKVQAVPIHQVKSLLHPHGWHDTDWHSYEWNKENKQEVRIVYSAPTAQEVAQQAGAHDYSDPTLACSSCGLTMGESRTLGHIKLGILAVSPAATQQAAKAETAEQAVYFRQSSVFGPWIECEPSHPDAVRFAAPTTSTVSAPSWQEGERIANVPIVDDALRGFSADPTADNGTCVVIAVLDALRTVSASGSADTGSASE